MENNNHTNNPFNNKHSEGKPKKRQSQRIRVFISLYNSPKTMLMAAKETGIERANICRHIAKLKRCDRVKPVGVGLCAISKHRAVYYSTNPSQFSKFTKPLNTGKLWN